MVYILTEFFFEDMVVFNDAQKEKYAGLMGEGIFRSWFLSASIDWPTRWTR